MQYASFLAKSEKDKEGERGKERRGNTWHSKEVQTGREKEKKGRERRRDRRRNTNEITNFSCLRFIDFLLLFPSFFNRAAAAAAAAFCSRNWIEKQTFNPIL